MRPRDKNSSNQLHMRVLFGDDASKMSADHNDWPEPYSSIYWRLFQNKATIALKRDVVKKTKQKKQRKT